MAVAETDCIKRMDEMSQKLKIDFEVDSIMKQIQMNQYQVQAYERLLKSREKLKFYGLILKLGGLFSGSFSFIATIFRTFVPL